MNSREGIGERCYECPLSQGKRVLGKARGCPGAVEVEVVSVALKLDHTTEEIAVRRSPTLCGRRTETITGIIGAVDTEHRIVDDFTGEDDVRYVTVAIGPRAMLDRHYGPVAKDTPEPPPPPSTPEVHTRPHLEVIPGGISIGGVYTALDQAVELLRGIDFSTLILDGLERTDLLHEILGGSENPHADAVQNLGSLSVEAATAALNAATELEEEVQIYKDSTGA